MRKSQPSKKKAKRKSKAGRPTLYKPEYCTQARMFCEKGATVSELAEFFGVSESTVWLWRSQHTEFMEALCQGKEGPTDRVERSLFERAVGYTFTSEKIAIDAKSGAVVRAKTKEHVPPDIGAGKFWLVNKRPEQWRDKQAVEHTGKDGEAIDITDKDRARALASFIAKTRAQP